MAELCVAILNGDYQEVEQLLAVGVSVNGVQQFSDNAAHIQRREPPIVTASRTGNEEMIKLLLRNGANVNQTTEESGMGMTALHWACAKRNQDTARLLLEHGAIVNQVDYYYGTPLLEAVCSGSLSFVQLLVLNKGDMNNPVNGAHDTPLTYAAMGKQKDIMAFLIGAGADVNQTNFAGDNALRVFYSRHAPVDQLRGSTQEAVYQFVGYLLDAGCTVATDQWLTRQRDEILNQMVRDRFSQPHSLVQLSRNRIRRHLLRKTKGLCILDIIYRLPLPCSLQKVVALGATLLSL